MAFPATKLGLMVELALAADLSTTDVTTWTWTDISQYVRFADGITITRGRADEFSTAGPATAKLTLLDPDGRFVIRNPVGAYYGQIGKSTPLRVLVRPDVNTASDTFNRVTANGFGTATSGGAWTVVGTAGDYATTGTVAEITHPSAAVRHYAVLPAVLTTFDATVRVRTGALATGAALSAGILFRYVDANNSLRYELLFNTDQSIQVRAVLRSGGTDGAGASHTVAGLTHVAGTYYRVRAQSTSVNGGSFRIKVWADAATEPAAWSAISLVSFATAPGTMGLTSQRETGNTNANATVDFDDYTFSDGWYPRHTGYVDEWPTRWNDAGLGKQYAPITASGISRRLQQGGVLQSAVRRAVLTTFDTLPVAYWPMEDRSGATQLASAVTGGLPMRITPSWTVGSGQLTGSDPVTVATDTGRVVGQVASYAGTDWTVQWPTIIPAATATAQALMRWTTSGSYAYWQLVLIPSVGVDQLQLQAYDGSNVERLGDGGVDFVGEPYGKQLWVEVTATQVGADISWTYTVWIGTSGFGKVGTKVGATAGTIGEVGMGVGSGAPDLQGTVLGHVSVWNSASVSLGEFGPLGWSGEKSTERFLRLGAQELIPTSLVATPALDFATMGPPSSSTLLTQFREIEGAEQGILYDEVDGTSALLPRESRFNQAVTLTLDVAQHQVSWPLEPADDDLLLHNDITSSQPSGSSYRYQDTTSNNAVGKVGHYAATRSVNIAYDPDLRQDAEFAVALGTVDEIRYPTVPIDLNRNPGLISSWLATNVGKRMQILHAPTKLTPDTIDLIVEGYTERLDTKRWTAVLNTSSARPWNAWILENGTGNQSRLDSEASTLAGAVTSGATTLPVSTTSGYPPWVTGAVSFDIGVGGERITVTNIGSLLSDTFTRTTANGWGTADTGQTWTTSGGSASDYSTNATQGVHNLSTTVTQRLSSLAVGLGPIDVYADWIHVPVAPTGAGAVTCSLTACKPDANNYVELQLFATVGGTMTVAVVQVAGGSVVAQDSTFPSVGTLTATYSARLHITNTLIQGRVWVRGTTEPTTWTTSVATASTLQAGDVAWRTERSAGTTNAAPYFVELDGLSLPTGQAFTVTRSVNGVVKAQSAAAKVSLWQPSVLAL